MKKIALVGMSVVALLLVSGCAKKEPKTPEPQKTVVKEPEPVVNEEPAPQTDETTITSTTMSIEEIQAKLEPVYFDFDKFNIRDDMISVVEADADLLKKDEAKDLKIVVEGNCDEWGTDEYNYALGLKRAKAVKDSLISLGLTGEKINTLSNGESNPVCTEKTKECWAKNRRADIKVSN